MTLLDKARATVKRKGRVLDGIEEAELVEAWLKGEITDLQASVALGIKPYNWRGAMAAILRSAVGSGKIRIEVIK